MSAPYSSKAVANSFLELAKESNVTDVSPMKLQKLIYYAHAWYLAFLGQPLIKEEVQAWKFGPVIPDVYFEFKECGNSSITTSATELKFEEKQLTLETPIVPEDDKNARELIAEVFRVYGKLSPIQLSNLTHGDNEPWRLVANAYNAELPRNIEIPNSLIESCFKKRLEEKKNG
jgi:uncharacterized phage-associated protein